MTVPGCSNPLLMYGDAGAFQVSRSLRFDSSSTSYLSRTPSVAGNRKTWTWSGWVKRSKLGSGGYIFSCDPNTTNYAVLYWDSGVVVDALSFQEVSSGSQIAFRRTAAVYRDPSAWYHIVFAVDTTQATAADRIKLYVNGTQVTTFNSTQDPTQNSDLSVNSTSQHNIGRMANFANPFDGYLANVQFIDGQQLTPSSFTEVSATTGQLIPKAFSGSYGTNGFYLKFADNSTTAALGTDSSGNGNTWTTNNFSVVGGVNAITIPASNAPPTVDYLVVAGGGGGGGGPTNTYSDAAGGGAGGLRSTVTATGGGGTLESPLAVVAGTQYTVTVGAGGATGDVGANGGNSVFGSITSTGGGGGGTRLTDGVTNNGSSGGSGGGAAIVAAGGSSGSVGAGTANQGYAGGLASGPPQHGGGAGGGAGAVGGAGSGTNGGTGGAGVAVSITGSSVTYAGGGGGGIRNGTGGNGGAGGGGAGGGSANGTAGATNTGGGGGGGAKDNGVSPGGAGGSGIVVIRYANTYADLTVGGGLTYTYANTGGYKIYSFTASATAAQSAGNDSLVDTPTSYGTDTGVGNEVRGNYCTWNPLDNAATLSDGNLKVTSPGASWTAVRGTFGVSSGKWYWESTITQLGFVMIGVANSTNSLTNNFNDNTNNWMYFSANGNKYGPGIGSGGAAYAATYAAADIISVALDMDAGTITFYKNGSSLGQAFSGLSGIIFPFTSVYTDSGAGITNTNFGQRAFAYPLSGFKALCDTNLPAPLTAKPNTLMDVALYTGNGGTQTISGLAFEPDFVWLKGRSVAYSHQLYDQVRGAGKLLNSNLTSGESTVTDNLTAFTSAGFTLGNDAGTNQSSATYVGWAWDAGTSTVSNTAGSITSQVRANVSAGFSVATFNSGSSGNKSFGHGLNVAPSLVLIKNRTSSGSWITFHRSAITSVNNFLRLESTVAIQTGTDVWGTSLPDSSLVYFSSTNTVVTNVDCVCYSFAPVVGYSSFGSYTGNGSANGPFVYTGMRPRWVLFKRSDTSSAYSDWYIIDSARNIYNLGTNFLRANSSDPENYYNFSTGNAGTFPIDFLSNGFKYRLDNSGADVNANGGTYIYAAFAENPFQYARAR